MRVELERIEIIFDDFICEINSLVSKLSDFIEENKEFFSFLFSKKEREQLSKVISDILQFDENIYRIKMKKVQEYLDECMKEDSEELFVLREKITKLNSEITDLVSDNHLRDKEIQELRDEVRKRDSTIEDLQHSFRYAVKENKK